jgi:hypothetical protein
MHAKISILVAFIYIYITQKHNLASQNKNNIGLKTKKQTTSNKEFKIMWKQKSMIKAKVAWKSVDTHYIAMKKEKMTWRFWILGKP